MKKSAAINDIWSELEILLQQGMFSQVFALINQNQAILFADDPLKMLNMEIDCLRELNALDAIDELINRYRAGRYVSQSFEDRLKEIENQEKRRRIPHHNNWSYSEIIELLKPEVPFRKQAPVLSYLGQTSAAPYLKTLVNLLINSQNADQQKFVLLLLVKSEFDESLTYTTITTGKTLTITPNELVPPLTSPLEIKIIAQLETLTNNVTINQIARDLFQQMSINLYPQPWQETEFNYLLSFLEIEAQKMLKITVDVEQILQKYTLNPSEYTGVEEHYRKICW